jgi:hypothetical protein
VFSGGAGKVRKWPMLSLIALGPVSEEFLDFLNASRHLLVWTSVCNRHHVLVADVHVVSCRTTKRLPSTFPSSVVPQGKIHEGHSRGIQNVLRPIWPNLAAYGTKLQHSKDFCNFTMAAFGWLWSTDCGSHGRGPRFDPLCAHQFCLQVAYFKANQFHAKRLPDSCR